MINKIITRIKKICARRIESKINYDFIPDDISIISCSCIGGVLYHKYGKKFLSPTIDLFIEAPDFMKFCLDIRGYISKELKYIGMRDEYNYPVGLLGDIKIYFVHYKSFEEAKAAWNRRKERINFDNIYVIGSDRDFYYEELLESFNKIPYKKVMFMHENNNNKNCVYIEMDKQNNSVGLLTDLLDFSGTRRSEKYFDFDKWFSGKYETWECRRYD